MKAQAELRQGLALVKAKQSTAALAAFDRAIAADPKGDIGARALYESAWLAHDSKQSTDEAERWKRLEAEFPTSQYAGEAAFQQGETLFEAKSWQDAATAYRRVTEKYPQSQSAPLAWYKLGSALYNLPDWKGAAAAFDKAATFPKSEVAAESSFWAAESTRRAGDWKAAAPRYESFLKNATGGGAPENIQQFVPAAHLGLGQALLASGESARAITEFQSGLEKAQGATEVELHFRLGEALLQQKNYKAAATQFLKVATLYNDSEYASRAQWNAAQAMEQSGDANAAQALYKAMAARQPADEWTAKAQAQLKG
jgi:TolA-binding protein